METPEQEGFGEASLGDAQASDAPNDPDMLDDPEADAESPEDFADDLEDDPASNPDDDALALGNLRGG